MKPFLPVRTPSRVIPPLSSLGLATDAPYETAFESFYWLAFWPLVENARRWVKRKDGEDVVQTIFEILWRRKDDETRRLRVWDNGVGKYLIRAVRRRCFRLLYNKKLEGDYIEAQAKRVAAGVYQEPCWDVILPGLDQLDTQRNAAIAALSPQQKKIYLLHTQDRMTDSAIANMLGLALGTVQTHLKRARKALKPFDFEGDLPAHLMPVPR